MASQLRRRGARALALTVSAALTLAAAAGAPAHAATPSPMAQPASLAKHTANLTEGQASAQARKTGKAVPVVGDTTAESTVTANANGTFTQSTSNQPVRAQVNGAWQNLDATLVKTADGGYAPKLSSSGLEISGGGGGALARMAHDATGLTLNLPTSISSLPTPQVSGATATYANVLPGVDLQITVTAQGGFSEVLVVKTAKAAANPALTSLSFPASTTGVHLATEADGGITASTKSGQMEYTAPAATMWDSATNPAITARAVTATNNITHVKEALDPHSGNPVYSSPDAAGAGAHTASLSTRYANGRIILTPSASVLRGAKTLYPVYIDPSYNANDPRQNWTYIRDDYPTQSSNFDATDSEDSTFGDLRVGYSQNDTTGAWFNAESMVQMGISESTLHTAHIWGSTLYTTEEWSYSCTGSEVDLYQVNGINSGTQWDNFNRWSNPGDWPTEITSKPLANEYGNTSCAPASTGWDVTTQMKNAISADKGNIAFGLTTPDENNSSEWHRFATTVTQTTTYDRNPNTPTLLHTSPSTGCTTTAADISTIGLGNVTLYAGVSDPDGGTVYAYFKLWNTSTGATVASTDALAQGSGTPATYTIDKKYLSQTTKTEYSWDIYVTDGPAGNSQTLPSQTSATCDFWYDPTVPGAPDVAASSSSYQVGQPGTFTITPGACPSTDASCTTTPTSYIYQLNTSDPITVPSMGASTPITVRPMTQTFTLTVTAQSVGGNLGPPAAPIFYASAAVPTADKDLNGDGTADLVTTGQTDLAKTTFNDPNSTTGTGLAKTGLVPQADTGSATPAGLWLDDGNGTDGQLATGAADIGTYGNGLTDPRVAANFTGTESITGNFTTDNFQDVLEYNPLTGIGAVIGGSGDGSPLQTTDTGNITSISRDTLQDATSSEDPLQVANAYTSVNNNGMPDLVGINGDDTNGYYLDYYASFPSAGEWAGGVQLTTGSGFTAAPIAPPSGAWNTWTIYSAEIGGSTNLILWQPSTGLLYDWAGFSYNPNVGTGAVTIAETYELSSNFETGATNVAELEAAATPDGNLLIYTDTTGGTVNADEFTNLSTSTTATDTQTVKGQPLSTSGHAWALNDYGNTPNTAADNTSGTPLNLTGATGVYTHTGDLFDPDTYLDGDSVNGADLSASGNAIDLTHSFTLSLWAKPSTYGTTLLSQDGASYPGIVINTTSAGWVFYLAKDNGATSGDGDAATGGSVQLGNWAQIQATYNAGTKVMELFVDDTLVATTSHTAPTTGATGDFRLGSNDSKGAQANWYVGQLSQVQTWGGVALAPTQPISPAAYHQAVNPERILDTRQTINNPYSNYPQTDTPVGANATVSLPIAGDTVTAANAATTTPIPANVTAAAVDITVTSETSNGLIIPYADGSQVPVTSAANYAHVITTTAYQIVPVGPDGKIALYNSSTGTAHILVDITGYYAPDPNHILTNDQTYHPMAAAQRILNTTNGTHAPQAKLAPGASLNVTIAGVDGIPTNATTIAINLTAANQTGGGILQAYQTGTSPGVNTDTSLTYLGTATASLAADVNLGTGTNAGEITITNTGTATTDVIGDVQGYFTNNDTGQLYHTVNPTRLVDTSSGIGGTTGAIAKETNYKLNDTGQTDAGQITTSPTPTYALQLTVAAGTAAGELTAYPDPTNPLTSNVNWTTNQIISNLALVQPGSDNTIDLYNGSLSGSVQLIIDTSGYFAPDPYATAHDWQLNDGTGATGQDTVGSTPLSLSGSYTWTTSTLSPKTGQTVLGLDGLSAYGTTTGPAVNTTGSFTVSAWAELSSLSSSSYATVIAQSGTQASGFYLQYNASWQGWCLNFMAGDTAGTGGLADVPCSSGVPTAGTWYYLVGTYNAASNTAALYVNGALANSVTGIKPWAASGNLTVGAGQYNAIPADFFPGQISNAETYNYPLSAAQISEIYQQG